MNIHYHPYNHQSLPGSDLYATLHYGYQAQFPVEEEEEDQQTIILGLPVHGTQPPFSDVPLVQGTPLLTRAPFVPDVPLMAYSPPGTEAAPTSPAPSPT